MKTIYTWTAREQGRLHGAYEQFSPTEISCDFCCVTFVSLFINLRHPRDFTLHTPQRGTLHYYIYICVFLALRHFSLPASGLFSCSRRRGTQGARPDPARKFGPWPRSAARALGVQSGKSPRGGIPSTWSHPGACKPKNRLKQYPTAHVISGILNVINVVRDYLLSDGKVFPRHQRARHATTFSTII